MKLILFLPLKKEIVNNFLIKTIKFKYHKSFMWKLLFRQEGDVALTRSYILLSIQFNLTLYCIYQGLYSYIRYGIN